MKVLHFSTTGSKGGAGKATGRLHAALLGLGVDSKILSRDGVAPDATAPDFARALDLEMAQSMFVDSNRTELSNTLFSLGLPGPDFRAHPAVTAADVLHLHWVSGLLSVPTIGQLLASGKPVVWTFHDQWAFTGGCHYSAGCENFQTGCKSCPQLHLANDILPAAVFSDKQTLWAARDSLTLVALTGWMESCIKQSRLFASAALRRIPNGIDLAVFAPARRAAARQKLGLAGDTLLCLFVSQSLHERRKGYDVLKAALSSAAKESAFRAAVQSGRLAFACLGHETDPTPPVPVKYWSWMTDEAAIADCYAAADIFLAPSREDNLPNTIVESLACGTPVIGAAAGGIPEMIIPEKTGLLVPAGDAEALSQTLKKILQQPNLFAAMRPACRAEAEKNYSDRQNAGKMAALYQELVSVPRRKAKVGPALPPAEPCGPAMKKFLHQPSPALPPGAWQTLAGELGKEIHELQSGIHELHQGVKRAHDYIEKIDADRQEQLKSIQRYQQQLKETQAALVAAHAAHQLAMDQTVGYLRQVEADSAERLKSIEFYQGKLKTAYSDHDRNVIYMKTLEAEIQKHIAAGAEREARIAALSAQLNATGKSRPDES